MSDTHVFPYPTVGNVIPQLCHSSIQQNLNEPMRNSAPSRLQNFDDFYGNATMHHAEFTRTIKSKTNSLTNVFSFDRIFEFSRTQTLSDPYSCTSGDSLCCITERMRTPSNSPTESDVSNTTSPIDQKQLLDALLSSSSKDSSSICNNQRDFGTVSLSSDYNSDRTECLGCNIIQRENDSDSALPLNVQHKTHHLEAQTEDDFDFSGLHLREISAGSVSGSSKKSVDDDCESGCVIEELEGEVLEFESVFSCLLSSDETDTGATEEKNVNPGVVRCLSDSAAVNPRRRKPLKRAKSVHFADTKGYELEIHIPISDTDDYYVPPRLLEALEKLRAKEKNKRNLNSGSFDTSLRHYSLVLNFQQPFLEPTFQTKLNQQNVCLESVSILPNSLSFTGVIRVVNLEFEKRVIVRYSNDNWKTYHDVPASYVSSLSEFHQDQFSFHVVVSSDVISSKQLQMAIRYSLIRSSKEYWDNNYSRNYLISCLEHRGNCCDDLMMT